jgi:hypothetical protein
LFYFYFFLILADTNLGLADTNLGLADTNLGLADTNLGLADTNLGLADTNICCCNFYANKRQKQKDELIQI